MFWLRSEVGTIPYAIAFALGTLVVGSFLGVIFAWAGMAFVGVMVWFHLTYLNNDQYDTWVKEGSKVDDPS